jgi:D-alanyl-D-alanine carboxypeptidase
VRRVSEQSNAHVVDDILSELGIPRSYGINPPRPRYGLANGLVDVEPNIVGQMQQLTAPTAEAWRAMKARAGSDGISLLLVSGFRSIDRQAQLIRRKLELGQSLREILNVNAAPGYSQHHTGQAVDLATLGCPPLTEAFERTPAYAWLCGHAGEFGFSLPYGRENALGFSYEPWHWSTL